MSLLVLLACSPLPSSPRLMSPGDASRSGAEIIVDDEDGSPTFTTTGDDWTTWSTNGYGFDSSDTSYHYLSHTLGGDDRQGTATWAPELPTPGRYQIDTWFRRTENRTTDADHIIYDSSGDATYVVIDQQGEGGSGWVSLGEFDCEAGSGGCMVVLDGTDDDESDEANAMRFTLIEEMEDDEDSDCDEGSEPGTWMMTRSAGSIAHSGWESTSAATGDADGSEASSPNVDEGEYLSASGWSISDPVGEETITAVELGVLGRMQYDSGTYELVLAFDGGGTARTTYSQTGSDWITLDVTDDLDTWTWADVEALTAWITLEDHPGGARDSDAWVDAFSVTVTYVVAAEEEDADSPGQGDEPGDDTGFGETPDTADTSIGRRSPAEGCSQTGRSRPGLLVLVLVLVLGAGRSRHAEDQ